MIFAVKEATRLGAAIEVIKTTDSLGTLVVFHVLHRQSGHGQLT